MRNLNSKAAALSRFLHKWAATAFFVGFMSAQVMTFIHLSTYKAEVDRKTCETRQVTRDDLRSVLLEIIYAIVDQDDRENLLVSIEKNYPPLEC